MLNFCEVVLAMDSKSAKLYFQACGCSFSQLIREGCRQTVEYLQQHVDPATLLEWRWESVCDKYEECFYPGLGNPLFELAGLVVTVHEISLST